MKTISRFERFRVVVSKTTNVVMVHNVGSEVEANGLYGYYIRFGNAGRVELIGCVGCVKSSLRVWNRG